MKKILLLPCVLILLMSCKREQARDYVLISGNIANVDIDSIGIVLNDNLAEGYRKQIPVLENGTFYDTLYIESGHYNYFDGKRYKTFYLQKGSDVNLSLDTKRFDETFTVTGKGSEIAKYVLTKAKKKKEILGEGYDYFKENESVFLQKMEKVKTGHMTLLEATEDVPEDFKRLEAKNIGYEFMLSIQQYGDTHRYLTKKEDFKVSPDFLDAMGKDFDDHIAEDYRFSKSYGDLLWAQYEKNAVELMGKDTITKGEAMLLAVSKNTDKKIKDDMLYGIAESFLTSDENLKNYYTLFMDNSTHKENNDKITDLYTTLLKTAPGSTSPKFVDYENHNGKKTSLDDFNGRYVYIDVWATWCGPCKKEIPFLKELEKQYHSRNIEFVSISVDVETKRKAWKDMVAKKEMTGTQLLADKDFNSEFIKGYAISAIPRFILIDPQGNIIKDSAPRPSDPELKDLLNDLGV